MRTFKWISLPFLLLLSLGTVWPQNTAILDKILVAPSISVEQAAYLVLVASGQLSEDSTPDQAFALLQKLEWLTVKEASAPVKLAPYAYLLTRSFHLSGGLMSTLFRSPRYSYRDLVARGVISSGGDPDDTLTGVEAVRILAQVMDSLPGGTRS